MPKVQIWTKQDLDQPVQIRHLSGSAFTLDSKGTRIGVECYRGGVPVNLTGSSCTGYIVIPNGETVTVAGTVVSGTSPYNRAYIDLPQGALLLTGPISIFLKLVDGSVITTIGAFVATVYATQTASLITPSQQTITDWANTISAALQQFVDDLAAEAIARENADTTLQGNIDAEATARGNADTTLQGNIDAEATARGNADNTLQGNIDAEAAARQGADNTLQGNINTVQANLDKLGLYVDSDGYLCHKLSGE